MISIVILVLWFPTFFADGFQLSRRSVLGIPALALNYQQHVRNMMGTLWLPEDSSPVGLVIMLHERNHRMNKLAAELSKSESVAVWATPCDDATPSTISATIDGLEDLPISNKALKNLTVIGQGIGGTMAIWIAQRCFLPPESTGARPKLTPSISYFAQWSA